MLSLVFPNMEKRCEHVPSSPVVDGVDVEVDKPHQRVLVHGVDVGQVGDAEEEHAGVLGDGTVARTRLIQLLLCLLSNLLLLGNLVRENLRRNRKKEEQNTV